MGNTLYYLHSDHLGSTSLTTDSGGNSVGELKYYPFGETRFSTGTTPTDRRFTGQREQSGLGSLYFFQARFYSPRVGRFLSADTLVPSPGNPQSLSRYSYTYNNPLKFIDPTGHDADCSAGDTACKRRVVLEEEASAYGLSFTGEWDYNDMVGTLDAVRTIANGLASTLSARNRREHGIDGTPIRFYSSPSTFRQTFGGVTFNRNPGNCGACWAQADNPWGTVQVYVQNVAHGHYTAQNAAHELGHTFDWRTGFQARADLQQKWNDDPAFPRRDPANVDLRGYAGPRFGWQQSNSLAASEEFADMFLGWAYSRWETDVNGALTPDGVARSNWMNSNMRQWIALAIDQQ
jgi:RHS repeat-associated protein